MTLMVFVDGYIWNIFLKQLFHFGFDRRDQSFCRKLHETFCVGLVSEKGLELNPTKPVVWCVPSLIQTLLLLERSHSEYGIWIDETGDGNPIDTGQT